ETERWEQGGRLVEAGFAYSQGGELEVDIALKKIGPQEYSYKGKHSGKDVSGKFKTKGKKGLASGKMVASIVASELLSGKAREVKIEEYHPSLNPEGPIEVAYQTQSKADRRIKATLGQMSLVGTADAHGELEKIEMPMGPITITQERVFV